MLARLSRSLLGLSLLPTLVTAAAHAQWTQPTPEELSMTSQSEVPGASAVYLFREETTEDKLRMFSVYNRIKVLSDGGKKFGDVELKYFAGASGFEIGDIAGRTIHPDGTVVPFTGKPYEKLIEKGHGYKYKAKVFSMPDVEVGSIIEYRYKLRYDDAYLVAPQWYIQSDLFTRKAHYRWKPTNSSRGVINSRGQASDIIAWTPILPQGVKVVETVVPGNAGANEQSTLDLNLQNVAPSPEEDYMPPLSSFTYRVLFYYSAFRTPDEFWKSEAKFWAKDRDKFIGPGSAVKSAVSQLISPADTPDQKLRKIYAAVQTLDNTRFTRNHSQSEDKSLGFHEIKSTDDIWLRKRGSDDQIAQLFVAMARAAGFKAYLMAVTARDRAVFYPAYLSLSQLDDDVAIVNVDGKELFFDPGSRFCPYGQLDWKHDLAGGIRQTDGGAVIAGTPSQPYKNSRVLRVANLTMDKQGLTTGTVRLTFIGVPALRWRQATLEGDEDSLKRDLRSNLAELIPRTMETEVTSIDQLNDFEKPLTVVFNVKGVLAPPTGKRLILPGELFEANSKPAFPHEKRDMGVYFHYGHMVQDAIRITFPKEFSIESIPVDSKLEFQSAAAYNLSSQISANSVTIRRNYSLGEVIFLPKEYTELRTFYAGMESKDQQNVILKLQTSAQPEEKASVAQN